MANRRKEASDAAWEQSGGYFLALHVLHFNRLIEALVAGGLLDGKDVRIKARIEEAGDKFFAETDFRYRYVNPYGGGAAPPSPYANSSNTVAKGMEAHPMHLWTHAPPKHGREGPDAPGTVRVRATPELIDGLIRYEWERGGHYERRRDWRPYYKARAHTIDCQKRLNSFLASQESYTKDGFRTVRRLRNDLRQAEDNESSTISRHTHSCLRASPYGRDNVDPEFVERLRGDRNELKRIAEIYLHQFYTTFVPDLSSVPCNCKERLPECVCLHRFRHKSYRCALQEPPLKEEPRWRGKPLVSNKLYSGRSERWWSERRFSGSKRNDDETIRSHDKSAGVGMKGFDAGSRGVWKNDNAAYHPEQDDRASTRDRDRAAREGEKALQNPYDDLEGTPKSWSNPADAEPDYDCVESKIGNRVMEEGVIEPSKKRGEE
jgi:hypothetical protein